MTSRRSFVGTASQALAGIVVARPWMGIRGLRIPISAVTAQESAGTLLFEGRAPLDLHSLAAQALDAATGAGASYADIRLSEWYRLQVGGDPGHVEIKLDSNFSYGIRAIANGAWAFIHGSVPEGTAVASAARDAAQMAVGFAALDLQHVEFADTPSVKGTWATPIHGDPFVIPLQDQADVLRSMSMRDRLHGAGPSVEFDWIKEHRVYGATNGSLIDQTFYRSAPKISATGTRSLLRGWWVPLRHLGLPMSGGYETVLTPVLLDQLKSVSEQAGEYSRMPLRRLDIGRYPVVLDGAVMGAMFGQTVGVALESDRALGYESDATGMSYLSPPADILGKKVINPLLTVTATRSMPHYQAVKWDDDGVEPEDYTIMKDGVVVDYHTSRQTAPAFADWYAKQGKPVRSHGCAVSDDADDPVTVQMPHLDVAPAKERASLEDLYGELSHGLVVTGRPRISVSRQLTSGSIFGLQALEVVKGKVVGRVKDAGIQFQVLPFWKSLKALGDAQTVFDIDYTLSKGIPWKDTLHTTSAPAALFSDTNIVDTGRKL